MNEKSQDPEARAEARGRTRSAVSRRTPHAGVGFLLGTALRSRALPEAERFVRFLTS